MSDKAFTTVAGPRLTAKGLFKLLALTAIAACFAFMVPTRTAHAQALPAGTPQTVTAGWLVLPNFDAANPDAANVAIAKTDATSIASLDGYQIASASRPMPTSKPDWLIPDLEQNVSPHPNPRPSPYPSPSPSSNEDTAINTALRQIHNYRSAYDASLKDQRQIVVCVSQSKETIKQQHERCRKLGYHFAVERADDWYSMTGNGGGIWTFPPAENPELASAAPASASPVTIYSTCPGGNCSLR